MVKKSGPKLIMRNACLVGVFSLIALNFGCKRRDRLTQDTATLTIDPPALTLIKGQSQSLSAKIVTPGGSSSVSPEWEISSTAGSLNTLFGPTVILDGVSLGDVTVTATLDGQQATSNIAIVTYVPGDSTYDIYSDNGLPTTSGVAADIDNNMGSNFEEVTTGYTPEGNNYTRSTLTAGGLFWNVNLAGVQAGLTANLSSFTGGNLKFSIRFNRALTTDDLRIRMEDGPGVGAEVTLADGTFGLNFSSTDWQEVTIPLSNYFGTVDSTQIQIAFYFRAVTLPGGSLIVDIDAVRLESS